MRERERRCAQRTQASFLPTPSCTRGIEPRDRPAVPISVCSKEPHMGRDRRERERAAESICALCGVRPTVYSILGGIGGLGVYAVLYFEQRRTAAN